MAYIRGKGELVAVYYFDSQNDEKQEKTQKEKQDELRRIITEGEERTGLHHSFMEFICENCVPVGLKIYLCATVDAQ